MLTKRLPERIAPRLGLAALLGAVGILCFAPFELYWLAPLVWGCLFAMLRQAKNPREGLFTGLAFGLGFYLCGVSWVYVSLSVFGGMPWWLAGPAAFLFCAVMAIFPMLAGWAFKRWQADAFWRQAIGFAALMALGDWLKSWILTGFPWLSLGYSQTPPSPLAGYAPLLGVFGLSLLVALSGALLLRWRIGLPILFLLALGGQGLRQIEWTQPDGPPVSVALIQGNIPQEMKFRPDAFFRTLALYRSMIEAHPAQLTVLPETSFPVFLDQLPPDFLDDLRTFAQRQQGDIIIGTLTGGESAYFNSAVSLGTAPTQTYSKQHLVPYGEFIPPGFAWFMAYANIPASSFSRGPQAQPALAIAGTRVAAHICYEDVFGAEIIRSLPEAGILANLSNTAWFGRSLAQPQHLQISRMRALETGRPMLRATNTGMTAMIDAHGETQQVLPPFTTGVLSGQVQPHTGMTPYAQLGDWGAVILMVLGLCIGCIPRPRH